MDRSDYSPSLFWHIHITGKEMDTVYCQHHEIWLIIYAQHSSTGGPFYRLYTPLLRRCQQTSLNYSREGKFFPRRSILFCFQAELLEGRIWLCITCMDRNLYFYFLAVLMGMSQCQEKDQESLGWLGLSGADGLKSIKTYHNPCWNGIGNPWQGCQGITGSREAVQEPLSTGVQRPIHNENLSSLHFSTPSSPSYSPHS